MTSAATTPPRGLTEAEADRRRRGTPTAKTRSSRSYWAIARANVFTFFNNILFTIGVALIALGQTSDALASVGLGLINAVIGAVQEARAKRKLDQIALLTRPMVTVVRDGRERSSDPVDLVPGDVVKVAAGDQLAADGRLVGDGRLEIDESLLTGETDLVPKRHGDEVLSGSFSVTGEAFYEAERVGEDSYAARLTQTAREFQVIATPLQQQIAVAVRVITLVVALMSLAILLQSLLESVPVTRVVQISAVLSGQIPYGLFFMTAVAYSLGAATIARRGALAQQVNAIESLSNVDILCMDKTGTLTANRLRYRALRPLDGATGDVHRRLGEFVRSISGANETSEALEAALPGEPHHPTGEIAFASSRKWSALAFEDEPRRGVWVLGAVETLAPFMPPQATAPGSALAEQVGGWSDAGMRTLVFAHGKGSTQLPHESTDALPALEPVAVVALEDELRPEAVETIGAFSRLGIALKIISGDSPRTVAALARRAGFPAGVQLATGAELLELPPAEFAAVAREATVFGRVSPEQKVQIVSALVRDGRYVAMMGDGVNDALALKRANLGIAMQSGSTVTRNVADIVLLGDSFGALRPAFTEGRRIVAGLTSAMYLFLTRVATSTLLILAIAVVGLGFPYEPAQVSLTLFTVGIPSFFLTLWARADARRTDVLGSIVRFVIPAAIVTALVGVAVYTISYEAVLHGVTDRVIPPHVLAVYEAATGLQAGGSDFAVAAATIEAQTMLSIFTSLTAFLLLLFLEPPARPFTAWTQRSPDRRPAALAAALFAVLLAVVSIPVLANAFALVTVGGIQAMVQVAAVLLWFVALTVIWRANVFDRLFSLDGVDDA